MTNYHPQGNIGHLVNMEKLALAENVDLMIIRRSIKISIKRKGSIPQFRYFKKVKEFMGQKSIVAIYASRDPQNDASSGSTG